jgi:hypothetical protein
MDTVINAFPEVYAVMWSVGKLYQFGNQPKPIADTDHPKKQICTLFLV